MDPAKRLCIKNLPPDVTKKDIAELIKKRTRAQPQYIDLGTRDDGTPRRYAHVTVEGLKSVMEAINGVDLRGFNVVVEQANPHYSFALAEARRKREREENAEVEAQQKRTEELIERWNNMPCTITKDKPPKSFYHNKQRYASVASQIAKQGREQHRQAYGNSTMPPSSRLLPGRVKPASRVIGFGDEEEQLKRSEATVADGKRSRKDFGKDKRRPKQEKPKAEPVPPPPPEPPQPTKEEKKLSGLQARLAALREKMKPK
jgi:RNA recognition motif-containing protein